MENFILLRNIFQLILIFSLTSNIIYAQQAEVDHRAPKNVEDHATEEGIEPPPNHAQIHEENPTEAIQQNLPEPENEIEANTHVEPATVNHVPASQCPTCPKCQTCLKCPEAKEATQKKKELTAEERKKLNLPEGFQLKEGQYISKYCGFCPTAFYHEKHCNEGKDKNVGEIQNCGFLGLGCRAVCEPRKPEEKKGGKNKKEESK